jgi:uncharacterized protein YprB with RNaseH-like and TPR domain
MAKLVFDIETVGEDYDQMDDLTKEMMTKWIKKESSSETEYESALENLKGEMGFSPLTSEIVAIGVLDVEKDQGVVYFQSPGAETKEFEENKIKYRPMGEKEMLESFWAGASNYDEFISFNGRAFDVPFLMVRSALHKIKPTKDLMSNRYLFSQRPGHKHVDLQDQLTFYGALRRKGGLHLWCRLFGITSPKVDGMSGEDVTPYFRDKKFEEIARYNANDLWATKELYNIWREYFNT